MFSMSRFLPFPAPRQSAARGGVVSPSLKTSLHLSSACAASAEVFARLNSRSQGLTEAEARALLERHGPNTVSASTETTLARRIAEAMLNPFSIILMLLALVSLGTDVVFAAPGERDFSAMAIISVMLILSGALRLAQEGRSAKAAASLRAMVRTTAAVLRDGAEREIPLEELVSGDVVLLAAGDMIPADLRLFQAKDLFVSQSGLTGESEPVEKFPRLRARTQCPGAPLEAETLVFMGSNVVSGTAQGVVIATGDDTLFGGMARTLAGKRDWTSFDLGVNKVSWVFIRFMLCMAPVVLLLNGFTKGDWLQACLFALSVAVGVTPEMLPVIVTANLAKGALTMAKKKTIVKRLNAMQNFGAMDVLCTDKTGTLTQDKVLLELHLNVRGEPDDRVLRYGFLNSYFQTGLRNLLDAAILAHAQETGYTALEERFRKVDEIPFDFIRRRMSVVINDRDDGTKIITKGAVEEMLAISAYAEYRGEVLPLTPELRADMLRTATELNDQGMRVLGVAWKNASATAGEFCVEHEANMVFMGYLAFLDPPKESAAQAIRAFRDCGVAVKVLTGDNDAVTRHICERLGIDSSRVIVGAEIDVMDDAALAACLRDCAVFAKLSPGHKARLVRALRDAGHTVGFLGDGINDTAAMHAADVAVSVDGAVDIARETADIILLEKDLMVLEDGLLEGRKVFGNIIKYIKMTSSSNFGNMFSVVVASAFLPFLPMLPLQVLLLNLLYEISCMSMPWDNVDGDYLKTPRKWNASSIGRFMRWLGPTSSVFDITTYAALFFIVCPAALGGSWHTLNGAEREHFAALFQAGWFVESLWTQTLVIHLLRTAKLPFVQSRMSLPVALTTTGMIALGTLLPFTAAGEAVGFVPLPLAYFPWLAAMILGYVLLCQAVKTFYQRRFREFL